ncbi:hypothetical protein KEM48_004541 [Puccinia striiformis f. sp. tritici PST-130]|nr:hypothetical protein KEM48_004541 [Puccinia striiformis f. sp. tritici PST-130]
MVTFINEPVKALRAGALRKAKYQRLCFKDKPDLDGAYNAYQRAVYLITIENKLHVKPAGNTLGIRSAFVVPLTMYWPTVATNYNNCCKYNEVAGPIFLVKSIGFQERMIEFKGYVVLALGDTKRPILLAGKSLLAKEFLDVMAPHSNTCKTFFRFVNGQEVIKEITGKYPPPMSKRKRRGGIDDNEEDYVEVSIVCSHDALRKLITQSPFFQGNSDVQLSVLTGLATHGKWRLGWSGTNTGEKLAKLGVTLQIQENDQFEKPEDFCKRPSDMLLGQTQHILAAFAKGWVKLIGPPKPEDSINGPLSIGHKINNDESTNGDNPNMTVYVGQTGSAVSKKVAAKKGSIEKHSKAVADSDEESKSSPPPSLPSPSPSCFPDL